MWCSEASYWLGLWGMDQILYVCISQGKLAPRNLFGFQMFASGVWEQLLFLLRQSCAECVQTLSSAFACLCWALFVLGVNKLSVENRDHSSMLYHVGGWSLRHGERNSKQFKKKIKLMEMYRENKGCVCSCKSSSSNTRGTYDFFCGVSNKYCFKWR